MGIRFYCPNGHKLNVKTFQAGRRGICPKCDVRFRIPLESQIPADAPKLRTALAAEHSAPLPTDNAVDFTEVGPALSLAEPQAATADAVEMGLQKSVAVEAGPVAELGAPLQSEPLAFAPVPESSDAIWFVRPPTGGQFGPAHDGLFRQWVEEGRVGADSLVWREGWEDWQVASAVLSEFSSASTPDTPEGGESTEQAMRTRRTIQRPVASRKSAALLVFLTLASLGLMVALAWILLGR